MSNRPCGLDIARYEAEVENAVVARRLYDKCVDSLTQLMSDCYRIGGYLNACEVEFGEEGFLHVLAEAGIAEDTAQFFLQLKRVCNADPVLMDWLAVSDKVPEPAAWEPTGLPFNFASMVNPQLFKGEPCGCPVRAE